MIARMTPGAGLEWITRGTAIYLSHDHAARTVRYPLANRWESRDRMFRQAPANYDAADFNGTYDLDVASVCVESAEGPKSVIAKERS